MSSSKTVEQLTAEYDSVKNSLADLECEAVHAVNNELSVEKIKFHSIQSRVKALDSFLEKTERKQYTDPIGESEDLVGIRVICLFRSDIERIGNIIRRLFNVSSEENKIDEHSASSFGYMSFHFIAELRPEWSGPRYSHIKNRRFEIQVRTLAMDAWANISHYLDYKTNVDIPSSMRKDFYAISALFYLADTQFEIIYNERIQSRQGMKDLFDGQIEVQPDTSQELNLDSLEAYLRSKFPGRKHADSAAVSEVLQELAWNGIITIAALDQMTARAIDAFIKYEKVYPPGNAKTFSDIGVLRGLLELTCDDYRESRPLSERYEKFLPLVKAETNNDVDMH